MKHLDSYRFGLRRPRPALSFLCGAVLLFSVRQSDADAPSERAVAVLISAEETADTDDQFLAIRAQLSGNAIPIVLQKTDLAKDEAAGDLVAAEVAREAGAGLVFWIENADSDVVRMCYFIPNSETGSVIEKTLRVEEGTRSSRIELIAVAAAGMVERLYTTHQIAVPAPPPPPPPKKEPDLSEVKETAPKAGPRAEISAAYVGEWFADNIFSHGARLGIAFFPTRHLALAAAFSYMIPRAVQDEALSLTLSSRFVEIAAAARWIPGPMDIRLGAALLLDLRSFSARSLDDSYQTVYEGFRPVLSLMPFVSADWAFGGRFALFTSVGANIGLTETRYDLSIEGIRSRFLQPFPVKLQISAGFVVKI